jgi:hypothetical protein
MRLQTNWTLWIYLKQNQNNMKLNTHILKYLYANHSLVIVMCWIFFKVCDVWKFFSFFNGYAVCCIWVTLFFPPPNENVCVVLTFCPMWTQWQFVVILLKSVFVIYAETVTRIGYPSRPISWHVSVLYDVSMHTAHSLWWNHGFIFDRTNTWCL